MNTETYYNLKHVINLQHDLNLQELELKFKQSFYDSNEATYTLLQQKIQKLHLLKQTMVVETCKLELELFKTTYNLE